MRLIYLIACLVLFAQEPPPLPRLPPSDMPSGEHIQGRIVLFAWLLQWSNSSGDFVVRVADKGGEHRYVRMVYFRDFHAPRDVYPPLNQMAFVGKGAPWTFYISKPRDPESQCRIQSDYTYENGNEKGTIPAYIRTPGGEQDDIPPLESLPCYLLQRKGLLPPP